MDEPDACTRTDAAGRFELRVSGGRFAIDAPQHALELRQVSEPGAEVEARLRRGPTLRARLFADGRACAERRVLFATPAHAEGGYLSWVERTDADGRLTTVRVLGGMPIHAFVEQAGTFLPAFALTAPHSGVDLGEVHVADERVLEGQVFDADGLPLRDARVVLQPAGAAPARVGYTDRGGRFTFRAVPHGALRVGAAGGIHGVTVVDLPAGAPDAALELRLGEGPTSEVRATFPDGTPLAFAPVQYIVTAPAEPGTALEPILYLHARTDGEGRAVFRGLPSHTSRTCYVFGSRGGRGFLGMDASTWSDGVPIVLVAAPHAGPY